MTRLININKDFFITENKKTFTFIQNDFSISDISLKMLGHHQKSNAALAAMTALILQEKFSKINKESIKKGLENTIWAGRCELMTPNLMLDGAHNEELDHGHGKHVSAGCHVDHHLDLHGKPKRAKERHPVAPAQLEQAAASQRERAHARQRQEGPHPLKGPRSWDAHPVST